MIKNKYLLEIFKENIKKDADYLTSLHVSRRISIDSNMKSFYSNPEKFMKTYLKQGLEVKNQLLAENSDYILLPSNEKEFNNMLYNSEQGVFHVLLELTNIKTIESFEFDLENYECIQPTLYGIQYYTSNEPIPLSNFLNLLQNNLYQVSLDIEKFFGRKLEVNLINNPNSILKEPYYEVLGLTNKEKRVNKFLSLDKKYSIKFK